MTYEERTFDQTSQSKSLICVRQATLIASTCLNDVIVSTGQEEYKGTMCPLDLWSCRRKYGMYRDENESSPTPITYDLFFIV